jgi:adenylate cyclase
MPGRPAATGPGVVQVISACLQEAGSVLMGAGGYLDDANADCVRAFFGLAGEDKQHATTACRAALALRERLETRFKSEPVLEFGIALNTGPVHAGVFQTGRSRYFTGVGDDVDFTRRLSAANLNYGTRILLGAGTHQMVAESMEVRPMDMLFVPEAEVMFEVCELLAPEGSLDEIALARRDAFWKGIISYREGDYESASSLFEKADPGDGSDLPLLYYRRKVEQDLREAEAAGAGGNQKRQRRSHARLANTI